MTREVLSFSTFRFETLRKIRVSWDLGSLIMVLYDMVMIPMHLGWHFVNNRFVCFEATGYRPIQHRKQTIDIFLWRGRLKFNHVTYGHFVSFDICSYFFPRVSSQCYKFYQEQLLPKIFHHSIIPYAIPSLLKHYLLFLPSRELTYPTWGKGTSSSKVIFDGIC